MDDVNLPWTVELKEGSAIEDFLEMELDEEDQSQIMLGDDDVEDENLNNTSNDFDQNGLTFDGIEGIGHMGMMSYGYNESVAAQSQQNDRSFPCTLCDKAYAKKYRLKRHILASHKEEAIHLYPNEFQLPALPLPTAFKDHNNHSSTTTTNTNQEENTNHYSADNFSYDRMAKILMENDTDIVGESSSTQKVMNQDDSENRKYQCELCDKSYAKNYRLKRHMQSFHEGEEGKIFPCGLCSASFANNYRLTRHIGQVHEKNKKSSTKYNDLISNAIDHPNASEDNISEVKSEPSNPSIRLPLPLLLAPKEIEQSPKIPKVHQCLVCNKIFANSYRLNRHVATVHDKIHQCDKCSHIALSNTDLKLHVNAEHRMSNYQCGQCSKMFTDNYKLKRHIAAVHEGMKPYHCDKEGCDKTFANPTDLKRHIYVHDDIKPYPCEMCDMAFREPRLLKRHIASTHHEIINTQHQEEILSQEEDPLMGEVEYDFGAS